MQGFNMGRYHPPDLDPSTSNPNALHRRRAPGTLNPRTGSQTVRFEMPFPIWCSTCPKPTIIGQGVRFNAEKMRDGKYFSTTIWRFRLRHAACGGEIVMRTDPKNTAYEVVSGAKKRDYGSADEAASGAEVIMTDKEREELRRNAFAKLEVTINDREQAKHASERIDGLLEASARDWDDPYERNQKLRRAFRVGRKERDREHTKNEALQDAMGLGFEILPGTEEDARRAAVVDFQPARQEDDAALSKPLFTNGQRDARTKDDKKKGMLKAERLNAKRKDGFVSAVMGNTRAGRDPFLNGSKASEQKGSTRLSGVKRKREKIDEPETVPKAPTSVSETQTRPTLSSDLVNYDSD